METTLYLFVIAITLAIAFILLANNQQKRAQRIIEDTQEESRRLVAESTVIAMAGTLAHPHINSEMTEEEVIALVKKWIPVARNIVMSE